ncbi:all trans-polyprenyl-diphosphate synthase PDSS2-like [Galleria mellonella]|uniref:All trans-polyprenyl-diphosphate synthase PDSS2-like n=1 Tax=Galleria mellonella TaxID=7137 RepID=A0A6J1WZB3_GALME|nr:all trans-polyprenyl-diphosphate synthase PDSS2-like [Galleria mellonella]
MQIKILKLLKTAKNSSGIHCHVLARNHGINLYLSNKSLSVTKYSRWSGLDLGDRKELEWRDVLTEAEQIVGYPTSFLNLRWLFNDEIANTAIHLRKLVGSNHPLLKSAKNLLIGSKSNLQSVGLIILLISKAAGFNNLEFTRDQYDSCVLHSQRALAEIVEMKRTGHIIHKTMVNLREKEKHGEKYKDLLYGNKIVLLTGDYLLATCLHQLGGLRNNAVTELISTGLRDLVEGDFLGEHDKENNPWPTRPKGSNEMRSHYEWEKEDNLRKLGSNEYLGQGKDEWIYRTMLMSGSILGKGCQGAMKLANRGEQTERDAYILGGHLALIWQLYLDVKEFFTHPYLYSLVGAPVTFALWEYPTIYSHILEAKLDKKPVEYKQLYYAVRGTRAIDYLSNFLDDELAAVLKYSERFPVTDARLSLQKMALTIHGEAVQYIEM